MKIREILAKTEHTCLSPAATWADIQRTIEEAANLHCGGVCVPPSFVARARTMLDLMKKEKAGEGAPESAQMLADMQLPRLITAIGFPNGYSTTETKLAEAEQAISHGADELDVVLNIGDLKDQSYHSIVEELHSIVNLAGNPYGINHHPVKLIIETALLTDEEKIKICELAPQMGVAFIKTSTGCHLGARVDDVKLLREHLQLLRENLQSHIKIKASGGIGTLAFAKMLIDAGADRIGASKLVADAANYESLDVEI